MDLLDTPQTTAAVDALTRGRARRSSADVEIITALAALAEVCPPEQGDQNSFGETAIAEASLMMGWSRNHTINQIHVALALVNRIPEGLDALADGVLDEHRCRILVEATYPLDDEKAQDVAARVITRARQGVQSPEGFRQHLTRTIARVDPDGAEQRHQARIKDRRVEKNPLPDAMRLMRNPVPVSGLVLSGRG